MFQFGSHNFAPSPSNPNSGSPSGSLAPSPFTPKLNLPGKGSTFDNLKKVVDGTPPVQVVFGKASTEGIASKPRLTKDSHDAAHLPPAGAPSSSPPSRGSGTQEDTPLRDTVTELAQKVKEEWKHTGSASLPHLNGSTCEQPAEDSKIIREQPLESRPHQVGISGTETVTNKRQFNDPEMLDCMQSLVTESPLGGTVLASVPQEPLVPVQEAVSLRSTLTMVDFKPHPKYWYHDGSVVILVEGQFFRLHRSFLERKSPFFCRLFKEEPDRISTSFPKIQCPIHRINGRAEDFTRLLDALDDGLAFATKPLSFSSLASILRVSTALEFPDIRAFVIQKFEALWPDSSDAITRIRRSNALESTVLARECNVPSVLKPAMYELLRKSTFDFNCVVKGDGKETGRWFNATDTLPLQPADTINLISAREKLVSEWVAIAAIRPENLTCTCGDGACIPIEKQDSAWSILVHKSKLFSDGLYDPLCGLAAMAGCLPSGGGDGEATFAIPNWAEHKWCEGCITHHQSLWKAKRAEIWRKLDDWLALA